MYTGLEEAFCINGLDLFLYFIDTIAENVKVGLAQENFVVYSKENIVLWTRSSPEVWCGYIVSIVEGK